MYNNKAHFRLRRDYKTSKAGLALIMLSAILSAGAVLATVKSFESDYALADVGTDYYVDSVSGRDTNSGTNSNEPFKTLTRLQGIALEPGDQVLLKKGSTWTETLFVNGSGNSSSPIVVKAYGSGSDPVIDGNNNLRFGVLIDSKNYVTIRDLTVKNIRSTTEVSTGIGVINGNNIVIDNVRISAVEGMGGVYIYTNADGRGRYNKVMNSEISGLKKGSVPDNKGVGIMLWSDCASCGEFNEVSGNEVYDSTSHGIGVFVPSAKIRNNETYNNGFAGIGLAENKVTGSVIESNEVYGNCQKTDDCFGINLFKVGNNNIVRYNNVYSQNNTLTDSSVPVNPGYGGKLGTGGIRFDGGDSTLGAGLDYTDATGNMVYYNLIKEELDGIQVYNFNNISIANNTVYNSKRAGIYAGAYNLAKKNINVNIVNNIVANATNRPPEFGLMRLFNALGSSNYNLFTDTGTIVQFNNNASNWVFTNSNFTNYSFSAWQGIGQDKESVLGSPRFLNDEFELKNDSPALRAGQIIGLNRDLKGTSVPSGQGVEIGALEFIGDESPVVDETDPAEEETPVDDPVVDETDPAEEETPVDDETVIATCTPNWTCDSWSSCQVSGQKNRTCVDLNQCGTDDDKPELTMTCDLQTECQDNFGTSYNYVSNYNQCCQSRKFFGRTFYLNCKRL